MIQEVGNIVKNADLRATTTEQVPVTASSLAPYPGTCPVLSCPLAESDPTFPVLSRAIAHLSFLVQNKNRYKGSWRRAWDMAQAHWTTKRG